MGRPEEDACPYRIFDMAGSGFTIALIAAPYDAARGAWRSPNGRVIEGALRMLKTRTPARAGAFALWGLVVASYDCCFEALRGERDAWNKIAAMGAMRGTLAIRAGPRVTLLRTLEGAALWGVVELAGFAINAYFANQRADKPPLSRGDGEDQLKRFDARDEEGQPTTSTLTGAWPDPSTPIAAEVSDESFPTSAESSPIGGTVVQVNEQDTHRRLWVGGLVVAAAASAAHRYRLPLIHAANGALAKFNKLS